jgi:hypothetical protein
MLLHERGLLDDALSAYQRALRRSRTWRRPAEPRAHFSRAGGLRARLGRSTRRARAAARTSRRAFSIPRMGRRAGARAHGPGLRRTGPGGRDHVRVLPPRRHGTDGTLRDRLRTATGAHCSGVPFLLRSFTVAARMRRISPG